MLRRKWYAIHTYSGHEDKVKLNIEKRAENLGISDQINQVIVPKQLEVKRNKDGDKQEVQRKVFPGYVLVEMTMTDEAWHLIKSTSGVTGFISSEDKPVSLRNSEIRAILDSLDDSKAKPVSKWSVGEVVRIKDGPFMEFTGRIDEIMLSKEKVKVITTFFEREMPVEVGFSEIERI